MSVVTTHSVTPPPSVANRSPSPQRVTESETIAAEDNGPFAGLLALLSGREEILPPRSGASSTDLSTLTDRSSSTAREGRLTQLHEADVEQRHERPGRIAGANVTHAQRIEEAASRETRISPSSEEAPAKQASSKPQPVTTSASATSQALRTPGSVSAAVPGAGAEDTARVTRDATANTDRTTVPPSQARPPATTALSPTPVTRSFRSDTARELAATPSAPRPSVSGAARNAAQPVQPADARAGTTEKQEDGKTVGTKKASQSVKQTVPRESIQRVAFERIAKIVRSAGGANETVGRIELTTPAIGHLRINLRMKDDGIRVRLSAETPDARDVLMSQSAELRASLEKQGVRVERMEFTTPRGDGQDAQSAVGDGDTGQSMSQPDTRGKHPAPNASPSSTAGVSSAAFGGPGDGGTVAGEEEILIELNLDVRA